MELRNVLEHAVLDLINCFVPTLNNANITKFRYLIYSAATNPRGKRPHRGVTILIVIFAFFPKHSTPTKNINSRVSSSESMHRYDLLKKM
jgi:hypothetical protein